MEINDLHIFKDSIIRTISELRIMIEILNYYQKLSPEQTDK